MTNAPTRRHLSLVASQVRTGPAQLRAEYLRYHAACLDMMKRADNLHDRMLLRGLSRLWLMLAERTYGRSR